MTGYGDEEIAGRGADLLDSPQHDPAFYRHVREIAARQGRFSGEMWQRRKDGEEFLCAIETSVVQEAEGEPPLYVAVLTDITQQKRAEQELRYLANFDTLTNLPNRTLLSERLRSEEHTSELQSLMRISYAVFCLKKKKNKRTEHP